MRKLCAAGLAAGVVGLFVGGPAAAERTVAPRAGGPIELFATTGNTPAGTVVIAGAIGDFGTTLTTDKNGKPDITGNYVRLILRKGTFELDATELNAITSKKPPLLNNMLTCSFAFAATGPVKPFNGTGLYRGISGTLTVTVYDGGVGPVYTSGPNKSRCNTSTTAKPLADKGWIIGHGIITYR
jgi:hypothetical protein